MQLMPATAALLGVRDVFDPAENVDAGVRHLRGLLDRLGHDLPLALAAYNAGEQAVARHRGIRRIRRPRTTWRASCASSAESRRRAVGADRGCGVRLAVGWGMARALALAQKPEINHGLADLSHGAGRAQASRSLQSSRRDRRLVVPHGSAARRSPRRHRAGARGHRGPDAAHPGEPERRPGGRGRRARARGGRARVPDGLPAALRTDEPRVRELLPTGRPAGAHLHRRDPSRPRLPGGDRRHRPPPPTPGQPRDRTRSRGASRSLRRRRARSRTTSGAPSSRRSERKRAWSHQAREADGNRGAPRLGRGAPSVGGHGGPFEAPHVPNCAS